RVDRHYVVDVRIPAEDCLLALLHDPGELGPRPPGPERPGRREGVHNIPQRGELHQRDVRGGVTTRDHRTESRSRPKRARISAITSRVECCFASPAMATRPPAATTAARSGTDSVV